MKKLLSLLLILCLLFGCQIPDTTGDDNATAPPATPIDPPREPTETESNLMSSIGYSVSAARGEILTALTTAIDNILDKGLISNQPYKLEYATDDISVNGVITIKRTAAATTWRADISSYEITGTNNNIDYRLYGSGTITSEDEDPFASIKANILNYTGLNEGGWCGALITTGEIGQKDNETYAILNAIDENGNPHTWKISVRKISDDVYEGTSILDDVNLTMGFETSDDMEVIQQA